jgi:hypothetical protein
VSAARPAPRGSGAGRDRSAAAAHELRTSLNAVRTWVQVLEDRLGASADPVVRRALDGMRAGVSRQVEIIENLLEGGAVKPPFRRPAMGKRNDAKPDVPDDTPHTERPERPEPSTTKPEPPGGPRESKAEEDKVTRRGE